jgi:cbb3-type cytochrome oxidase subunit 3
MESGIFLCHWYFLFTAYLKRRRERRDEERPSPLPKEEERENMEGKLSTNEETDLPLNPIFRSTSAENRDE